MRITEVATGFTNRKTYSIGNDEVYVAVGDELSKCGNVSMEISGTLMTIANIGGNIEYLDVTVRGWNDSRGQYSLV